MTALTNPKKALDKICDIGNELNISVTKEEVIEYLGTIDDEATKMWLVKAVINKLCFFLESLAINLQSFSALVDMFLKSIY